MAKTRSIKIPKQRRKYHQVYALDRGLDYSKATTFLDDAATPNCREMDFRNKKMAKTKGTLYFAGTNTVPLLDKVMSLYQYYKAAGTSKLIAHTTTGVYAYNTDTKLFENITRGAVVENCEDVWVAPDGDVTCAVDTDERKGTNSIKVTIAAAFGTGIAAYEDTGTLDLSTYTHLHFFIKSDVATLATDLDMRVSEEAAGAITGGAAVYEDVSIPALAAGVWTECSIELSGTTTKRNAVESVSLIVAANQPAIVVNIDDVMATIETTGDEDDVFTSEVMNDVYVYSNNIAPLLRWNMTDATTSILYTGCVLAAKCIRKFGERMVLYGVTSTYPQRVQWTIVGGVSAAPAATDWTDTGSGNTDLEAVMGTDSIQTAEKLSNYMVIYGERTIALQDYTGIVDDPYAFYTRVTGVGLAAERAIANLGDEHIFLGWDDVYSFKGGKEATKIGNNIRDELFRIVNVEHIGRSFMIYMEEKDEVRLYIPTSGNTIPNVYFSYNLKTRSWSRGDRTYLGFGHFISASADTWNSIGDSATATWDAEIIRWDAMVLQALAPLSMYGNASGVITYEDSTELNLAGVALDSYQETKDYVTGEGYRRTLTNWMQLNFEAKGDKVYVRYSVDLGLSWSEAKVVVLTDNWSKYNYDFETNATQIRFKFRNGNSDESFEVRELEMGYIEASDRGV